MYSLYLRRGFPRTNSASFQIYRAVGSVSWPFQCCIEHDNELANHKFMICNSLELTSEPEYLQANHQEGASQWAIFPNTKPGVGRSNHQGSQTPRCDGRQHIAVDTSMLGPCYSSCTSLCSPTAGVVCQGKSS